MFHSDSLIDADRAPAAIGFNLVILDKVPRFADPPRDGKGPLIMPEPFNRPSPALF